MHSALRFSFLQHICHVEVQGLIGSCLTPGDQYFIYCSEGELPRQSILDKCPGGRGAGQAQELFGEEFGGAGEGAGALDPEKVAN